jgi:multidrug efflux pump
MKFTDIFIRRPVLAVVISLLILVLGLRSLGLLKVREFPFTQNAVVTVATVYTGSDPSLVSGFITTPLENSIAQANGIDYLTSSSIQSVSLINANLHLNYDLNSALTEISTKVNAVLSALPKDTLPPVITIAIGETVDSMYMGFYSRELPTNKITDYLIRVVQPKLQAVAGVQTAEILGERRFAMRAWLDPSRMAAYNVTATDVSNALANNDFISALGRTQGQMVTVNLTADTSLHTVDEFRELVLKTSPSGAIVRLADIANVTLGSEDYDTAVAFDGEKAVFIGIKVAPSANLLTVIADVREAFPSIAEQMPEGLDGRIVYDATKYVESSIREVTSTLIQALLIVILVIFLFLASPRAVIIPVIAMPLSLIGAFFIMYLLGYTINLLTLLALVLAIGLVVDDAIIVVENAHRHIEGGMPPRQAAIEGARELASPIIAMSAVLIAVYVPIGFMGGLTGALFTEFAYTLAGAVAISAIIALTLSPMMCSRFLRADKPGGKKRFEQFINHQFDRLRQIYEKMLKGALNYLPVVGIFAVIILVSNYFLFVTAKSELAPLEDRGIIISLISTAPDATLEQTQLNSRQVFDILQSYAETDHVFQVDGFSGLNSGVAGMVLKPWDMRKRTVMQLNPEVQMKLGSIAGARVVAFQPPSLPGSSGLPVQLALGTTESFDRLNEVSQIVVGKAWASGMFAYVDTDLKLDKPQTTVNIDRDKAAQLGLTMRDVGSALGWMLGGGYVNYFDLGGRSYKVIPQVMQRERLNAHQIGDYYFNTASGAAIPFSTILSLKTEVIPESINHFQQLNSAMISGVPAPGVTIGQALDALRVITKDILPQGYSIDYGGESRQFMKESRALLLTFFFALIIIFLALAAQFESFRDPFIVLISVPMSICGAMIFISLGVGNASLNIFTEVGLVTLIGLISKHGILIVQFANDQQLTGKSKREAIELAAGIRLRPILMTTAAMVLGVLPLVTATGAGAEGRFNMGLVILTGIAIGTIFTLFVVPAMYMFLAADRTQKQINAGRPDASQAG